jgi:hypothetical protein
VFQHYVTEGLFYVTKSSRKSLPGKESASLQALYYILIPCQEYYKQQPNENSFPVQSDD